LPDAAGIERQVFIERDAPALEQRRSVVFSSVWVRPMLSAGSIMKSAWPPPST